MAKQFDYFVSFGLKHDEKALKVNSDGEYKEIPHGNPKRVVLTGKDRLKFTKVIDLADKYLLAKLSPIEYKIVSIMKMKADITTNSLEPLNNEMSLRELEKEFAEYGKDGTSRSTLKKTLDSLLKMGVYGMFNLYEYPQKYANYWILNPYISHKSKTVPIELLELFKNTEIALYCNGKLK